MEVKKEMIKATPNGIRGLIVTPDSGNNMRYASFFKEDHSMTL